MLLTIVPRLQPQNVKRTTCQNVVSKLCFKYPDEVRFTHTHILTLTHTHTHTHFRSCTVCCASSADDYGQRTSCILITSQLTTTHSVQQFWTVQQRTIIRRTKQVPHLSTRRRSRIHDVTGRSAQAPNTNVSSELNTLLITVKSRGLRHSKRQEQSQQRHRPNLMRVVLDRERPNNVWLSIPGLCFFRVRHRLPMQATLHPKAIWTVP